MHGLVVIHHAGTQATTWEARGSAEASTNSDGDPSSQSRKDTDEFQTWIELLWGKLSVEDALRLSNAQSVDEWLAIFDKQGIFLDDVMPTGNFGPEPAGQNIMQAPPPRYPGYSSKLLSERRGPAVGVPLQQMPTTQHFGRHSGIQFAMNAGCAPEKVAVPIQVPDGALESRHYHIVPTCTRIERCGGCCNHELLSCQATAKEIMTMN
ncbi:unnamed protein product, partial [Notodromas monacha]